MQNTLLWSDYITWSPGAKSQKLTPPPNSPPKLRIKCANPLLIRMKKMCQISLNTYSHNEPYDLHAQVIFQKKKAYDDNALPITHTLF